MTRKQLLEALLILELPLHEVLSDLTAFGWDCDTELVQLQRDHIIRILERFQNGEISDKDVSDWADAVECRDDIGFEKGCEEILTDAIDELANPELTRPLSSKTANEWMHRLKSFVITSEKKEMSKNHSHINISRKKCLIAIDESLISQLTEIAGSKQIPAETLIDLWLKEKISESYRQT